MMKSVKRFRQTLAFLKARARIASASAEPAIMLLCSVDSISIYATLASFFKVDGTWRLMSNALFNDETEHTFQMQRHMLTLKRERVAPEDIKSKFNILRNKRVFRLVVEQRVGYQMPGAVYIDVDFAVGSPL